MFISFLPYFAIAFFVLVISFVIFQTIRITRTGKEHFLGLALPTEREKSPRERLEACLQEMQKRKESGKGLDPVLFSETQVALEKLAKNAPNPVEAAAWSSVTTAMQYLQSDEIK